MKIKKSLWAALAAMAMVSGAPLANAGPEPFIGEVQWFAGNFAPRGWAFCDGQLLDIAGNDALFSILGTTYGGDGRNTFALPDVRGRTLIHAGNGPGLTQRRLGDQSGTESETLDTNEIPAHTHRLRASAGPATQIEPADKVLASPARTRLYDEGDANTDMDESAVTTTGGGAAHNNMQPYTVLNCIIALQGIYPPRS